MVEGFRQALTGGDERMPEGTSGQSAPAALIAALDDSDLGVWLADATGQRLHWASAGWQRISARPTGDLCHIPSLWLDLVHPDDRDRVAEERRHLSTRGRRTIDYRLLRPDGTARWVRDLEDAYEAVWAQWVNGEEGDIWL